MKPLRGALRQCRWAAGAIKGHVFPEPEVGAWRKACRQAERTPRFTPGRIQLMDYDLEYTDLLTLCPQWDDLFVKQTLRFEADHPAPRILDCGANIGLATLYFKRLYPQARITAFEADPVIYAVLADNLRRNGADDVETVNVALWKESGEIDFQCEGADSGTIASIALELLGPARRVPSLRLRDVLEKEPVDLLKLDIEGAELPVLADCVGALDNVRALCLDLHEFDARHRSTSAILKLLERSGFTYSLADLCPLPWRSPKGRMDTPFPDDALSWALTLRAFRPRRGERAPSGTGTPNFVS